MHGMHIILIDSIKIRVYVNIRSWNPNPTTYILRCIVKTKDGGSFSVEILSRAWHARTRPLVPDCSKW